MKKARACFGNAVCLCAPRHTLARTSTNTHTHLCLHSQSARACGGGRRTSTISSSTQPSTLRAAAAPPAATPSAAACASESRRCSLRDCFDDDAFVCGWGVRAPPALLPVNMPPLLCPRACFLPARRDSMLALGRTEHGRAQVAAAFKLCGGAAALPSEAAVAELEDEVVGDYQGMAQVSQCQSACQPRPTNLHGWLRA